MSRLWFVLFIIAFVFATTHCYADGCFIPKTANSIALTRDADITEPNQNAFILFQDNKEELIIQVKYRGKLSEFLWLVPTPSIPTVKRFENALFEELHEITAPPVNYWFNSDLKLHYISDFTNAEGSAMGGSSAVNVIKQERTGIYDTTILKATNASDLQKWLNANGYPIPDSAVPVIADYLQRGWVFTAMRVNLQVANKSWKGQKEGLLEPLHFSFTTQKPVYPLKISSLNPGKSEILLYVAATNSVTSERLHTENNIIGYHINSCFEANIIPIGYLTKLRGSFKSSDMTEDIVLEKSDIQVQPTPISPPLLENIGSMGLFTFLAVQSFPYSMLVPGVLALICLKASKPRQRMRLLSIGLICAIWVYLPTIWSSIVGDIVKLFDLRNLWASIFMLPGPDNAEYMYPEPDVPYFKLTALALITLIVLTVICVRAAHEKRQKRLLIFGCMYALLTLGSHLIGYPANIAHYAHNLKSFSAYGVVTIVLLGLLCIFLIVMLIKKALTRVLPIST